MVYYLVILNVRKAIIRSSYFYYYHFKEIVTGTIFQEVRLSSKRLSEFAVPE